MASGSRFHRLAMCAWSTYMNRSKLLRDSGLAKIPRTCQPGAIAVDYIRHCPHFGTQLNCCALWWRYSTNLSSRGLQQCLWWPLALRIAGYNFLQWSRTHRRNTRRNNTQRSITSLHAPPPAPDTRRMRGKVTTHRVGRANPGGVGTPGSASPTYEGLGGMRWSCLGAPAREESCVYRNTEPAHQIGIMCWQQELAIQSSRNKKCGLLPLVRTTRWSCFLRQKRCMR